MRITRVDHGQSLIDIAIQEYGDVSSIPLILRDNPGISLARPLVPDDELVISDRINLLDNKEAAIRARSLMRKINTHDTAQNAWMTLSGEPWNTISNDYWQR